ncbi:hypothetical protein NTHI1209_00776 [Haemophilus influenzae]|uniref:Uncharacterized protein n=1 Tax=Haemophilus influenzae TaxID=727 RepID=A0A158SWC9_HAEIF|nr:hypothetical protein NTHI1209_00776 [Haemophilus influenzae]
MFCMAYLIKLISQALGKRKLPFKLFLKFQKI